MTGKNPIYCFLSKKQRDFILGKDVELKNQDKLKEYRKLMNHRIKKAFVEGVVNFLDDFDHFIYWCIRRQNIAIVDNEWTREAYRMANLYASWGTRKGERVIEKEKVRKYVRDEGLNKPPVYAYAKIPLSEMDYETTKQKRKYLWVPVKCPKCHHRWNESVGEHLRMQTFGLNVDRQNTQLLKARRK